MAKVQYVYVKRKQSETGQTGTVTYDLPERGFIPEITVRIFSTPTASTDPALPINDAITKIEIVDGATVIKSLTGNQTHGLEMIHGRPARTSTEVNDNAVEGYDDFIIFLGGKVNGIEYVPDFSKFSNPQIKITWDYSLTTGVRGATFDADASPAIKITVFCKVVREGAKYSHGYLKSSELQTWTQATSTTRQIEIPLGEKLYGIALEGGYDSLDFTEDFEQIKIDFDNGAWIPLQLYEEEIIKMQEQIFVNPFELTFRADVADGMEIDSHMGYVGSINIVGVSAAAGALGAYRIAWPSASSMGVEEISVTDSNGAAYATYSQAVFHVIGYCPYGLWYLPMSTLLNGGGDLIDTSAYGRIIVEVVSGSSASTSQTPSVLAEYLITR